jgi:hypothetical protein
MKLNHSFSLSFALATLAACSSSNIPIGRDQGDAGVGHESGGVQCGTTTCPTGDLCCPSADETCSPTCMSVTTCPVFGRPCEALDAGHDAKAGDSGSKLQWYLTCGDPVCGEPSDAAVVDAGTCPDVGTSCDALGQTCGVSNPKVNCGATLLCADHNPAVECAMSSRKFKNDIEYLGDRELQGLHDEALRMRLATYNYKGQFADPNPKHLGFIIEDDPQSLAVDRGHDRIDIYGYLSMVLATMQVQEQEIQKLEQQLGAAQGNACTSHP